MSSGGFRPGNFNNPSLGYGGGLFTAVIRRPTLLGHLNSLVLLLRRAMTMIIRFHLGICSTIAIFERT